MNTKRIMKIITIVLLALIVISLSANVFAAGNSTGREIDPSKLTPTYGTDDGGLTTKAQSIMGMIRNISIVAAVIIIMVLGVKFMLGSVEEKAEYKKSFMPLIVGIVLVVAATSIASFIFNMVK